MHTQILSNSLNLFIILALISLTACGEVDDTSNSVELIKTDLVNIDGVETPNRLKISELKTLEDITPEDIAPEDIAPEDITPEDITPEDITPEDITLEDITPEDITPEKIASEDIEFNTPEVESESESESSSLVEFNPEIEESQFIQMMFFAQTAQAVFETGMLIAVSENDQLYMGYFDDRLHLQQIITVQLNPNAKWTIISNGHRGALIQVSGDEETEITARFFNEQGQFISEESSLILEATQHTKFTMDLSGVLVTSLTSETVTQHRLSLDGEFIFQTQSWLPVGFEDDPIVTIVQKEEEFLIQYMSGALLHLTPACRGVVSINEVDGEPLVGGSRFVWDSNSQKFWGYAGFDHDTAHHIMRSYQVGEGFSDLEVDLGVGSRIPLTPIPTTEELFLVYPSDGGITARGVDTNNVFNTHNDDYFSNVQKAWLGPRGESIIVLATARCTIGLVQISLTD